MKDTLKTTQVDILRHGECQGGHIFRGTTDVQLNPAGREQMRAACEKVNEQWDVVVTSPLKRCFEFSKELSDTRMIPLDVCHNLREMSFGDWEGQEIDHVWQENEELVLSWSEDPSTITPPNGEPLSNVVLRADSVIRYLLEIYNGQKILLVTHGGIIRVMLAHVLNMPTSKVNQFDVPFACLSRFAVYQSDIGERSKLLAHNFVS